jgi:hypothetical protein
MNAHITKTALQDIVDAHRKPPHGAFEVVECIDDDERRLSLTWVCAVDLLPEGIDGTEPWDDWGGNAIVKAAGLADRPADSADDQDDKWYTSYTTWTFPLEAAAQ